MADDEIVALLRAGEPHAAIARRLRVGSRRIATVAKGQGLTRRRGPRGAELAQRIDELLLQGEEPGEIARALECSRAYVYQRRSNLLAESGATPTASFVHNHLDIQGFRMTTNNARITSRLILDGPRVKEHELGRIYWTVRAADGEGIGSVMFFDWQGTKAFFTGEDFMDFLEGVRTLPEAARVVAERAGWVVK